MPIVLLWNQAVAGRLSQVGRWFDSFERSCFLLDRWLEKRLPQAERQDRATRAFPVFRFHADALTARVVSAQFGALLTGPVASVGDHVERALEQWNVRRRVRAAVRETRILPGLFRVFEEFTGRVLQSIDRFRTPTPEMFDASKRTFWDIPGLGVMVFRAAASNEGQVQILMAARDAATAFFPPPRPAGAPGGAPGTAGAAEGQAASALPLAFQLDDLARYLVAGLLLIPAAGALIGRIGTDALTWFRYMLLDKLAGWEGQVHAFRRRVLTWFVVDLEVYARKALLLLLTARDMAVAYLGFYARTGVEYLHGVLSGVGTFAGQLGPFWKGVLKLVFTVTSYVEALLRVDIGHVIHLALVTAADAIETIDTYLYAIFDEPEFYDVPDEFPVGIGELVMNEGAGARANRELARAINLVTAAWNGVDPMGRALNAGLVHWVSDVHIPRLIGALQGVRGALAIPRAGNRAQPELTLDTTKLPDLNALVIKPLRERGTRAVDRAVTGVAGAIDGVVVAAKDALDGTAATFERAAAAASRAGALRLVRRLTAGSDALVASLFSDQQKKAPGPTGLEGVAGVYAQWLIQGGFDSIGAAVAGFVGMRLDAWMAEMDRTRDTPVELTSNSPRKLLERARLGRVHTPELRIVVRGRALGKALADKVADTFQGAVQDAYATGQARLGTLRLAAGASAADG